MLAATPVNILLVDDQPAKLLSYEVILADLRENLIKATSGRDALEKLLKFEVAVILIDVCMPDLDGFELAQMIQDHPRFHSTAIIFVSAVSVTDLDRLKGYQHGAVDYIPVPVVPELLRARVRVFADLYRKNRALERLNEELEQRVAERTAALEEMNHDLERRVEERTRESETALAQIHQMQKLESLGQLTGGLAHDFNNLLMGVLGCINYLSKHTELDAKGTRFLSAARESCERGAALTKRLLAFARRQELRLEAVDPYLLISGLLDMLRQSIGPAYEIEFACERPIWTIKADTNQLELALLNLILNARDAMPEGGHVIIAAANATLEDERGVKAGRYVELSVTDSGIGMSRDTLKRCLEPFYTTKPVGKGTGLGLSAVHGMAVQSGGRLDVTSEIGIGTRVTIFLPATDAVASEEMHVAEDREERLAHRRILVVDDEAIVATATSLMLEDLGHTVRWVTSGEAALDELRGDPTIDIVITDHVMPGMNGLAFVAKAKLVRPGMPVILATGFADVPASELAAIPRLAKPYGIGDLERILRATCV